MRRTLITASAVLSVGGLLALTALPANMTMPFADDSSGAAQAQNLVSANVETGVEALDAIGAVSAEAMPDLVLGSNGLYDPNLLPNTKLRYPFEQEVPLTDGFGYRSGPVPGFHKAQDLAPGDGTPINIIGDGLVTKSVLPSWCGTGLEVQHKVGSDEVTSLYCHMQTGSHSYEVGDRVNSGDIAGRVGNTGQSYGAHLHLVLTVNGTPVDPLPYISTNAS